MNKYIVEVKEILIRQIEIAALSVSNAESLIKNRCDDGEINLNHDDCIEMNVTCITPEYKDDNQPTLFDDFN